MKRDLKRMSEEHYDLVVIGAGIYGATLAWDAALRGLHVALVDRGDFGGGTSSSSLKIIHGGLRYLQQLDFIRMRESIHERKVMMRVAPHLVHPLPVLMPTYSYKLKSRPALMLALLANDIVGFDRNGGLKDPGKFIPTGRTMSAHRLRELIPGYDKHNLNGGALWYDCQCHNTERLLLSFVLSAAGQGADCANHVQAVGLNLEGRQVAGIEACDLLSHDRFPIRARMVVNAGGPWVDEVLAPIRGGNRPRLFIPSSALNLVVNRAVASRFALGLSGPFQHVFADGKSYNGYRMLFLAPWRGRTLIGTDHRPHDNGGNRFVTTERQIAGFLADLNRAYPAAEIKREEVCHFNGGLLPMTGIHPRTGEVQLLRHYRIHDHEREDGVKGLLTVVGVKYTTARDVAQKAIDLVVRRLGGGRPRSQTTTTRLHGGDIENFTEFVESSVRQKPHGLDEQVVRHLCANHGSAFSDLLRHGKDERRWLEKITGSTEVIRAEVLHAVREEMALKLSDAVLRRTDLGSAGYPGDQALADVAGIMAVELGWSASHSQEEIEAVKQHYKPS